MQRETPRPHGAVTARTSERELVALLRARDEVAFAELVRRWHGMLIRIALMYVSTHAVAEEVVQETWVAVLRGIDGFEGRSSLKTWVVHILMNRARTIGVKEHRTIPFASTAPLRDDPYEGAADIDRFNPVDHPVWPMHWASPPQSWHHGPEDHVLDAEVVSVVEAAAEQLSPAQREVLLMRDVAGLTSGEVCGLLDITEGNQRVLLHRARARIRRVLEAYFRPAAP